MIVFLHNRYRTTGGEERVVEDLRWLVRERLGEPTELLARDSVGLSRARAAAGLLYGGLGAGQIAEAVERGKARVLHAHNLHPTLGWRALAAARAAGARTVLHLHQYRLVCAVGVCFTDGEQCTRCHGRNTLPGVLHNCRANRAEAVSYAAALSLWQRRLIDQVDAFIVPSVFARERLRALGAKLPEQRVHVLAPPLRALAHADGSEPPASSDHPYALIAARLSPEKGVDVAITACRIAGIPLIVAGEGPQLEQLRRQAAGSDVRFLGRVDEPQLERLRRGAAIALAPSRSAETFGIAAAEAMAAGVPVAGSDIGALAELIDSDGLAPPGDGAALADAIKRVLAASGAGEAARARVARLCAPDRVASELAAVYAGRAST
ncbi:MAG TPA: glycosyltransferase family 4 protein [Solirubrobacteraceae bacterium]|jgi:glycosyltransferase involved in cell wall biosynthesis